MTADPLVQFATRHLLRFGLVWFAAPRAWVLLLLHSVGHQLLLRALRAHNVLPVRDEALTHHAGLAGGADKAVVVPVPALEGDEPGASDPCNRLSTGSTTLGEQLSEAVSTVRLIIPGSEPLSRQGLLTVGAGEALSVPGIASVGHSALSNHLAALDALGGELVLVALGAVDVVLLRDERLCANRILAGAANEALFVPLSGLILHLLHPCSKNVSASITTCSKLRIVARAAVDPVGLATELLVDQAGPALVAQEAGLVPMLLFVGQILGVDTNDLPALVAVVCEDVLVALDAVGMVLPQHVPVTGKAIVAVMTEHDFNFVVFA